MTEHNPPELPPEQAPKVHPVWEVVRFIAIAIPFIFLFRNFVAQPFVVRGGSMEPNLHDKEYLVVYELPYHFTDPERGEVIVFKYPNDPDQHFVKRVVGLPGDIVEISDSNVTIFNDKNLEGVLLEEPYADGETRRNLRITLKEDEFFVMGDNRENSSDSRFWGPLKKEFITGRAVLRLWPLKSLSTNPAATDHDYQLLE